MPSELEVVIAKLRHFEDEALRLQLSIRSMILDLKESLDKK